METQVPAFLRRGNFRLASNGAPWVLDLEVRAGEVEVSISRDFLKCYARKDSIFVFDKEVVDVPEKFQAILQRFKELFYGDILVDRTTEAPLLEELLDYFQLNWFIGDDSYPSKLQREAARK